MTKVLQELLMTTNPLFSQALGQLERTTGNDGVDVRLIADIAHVSHNLMRQIGLDTSDTTARELYLALNAYVVNAESHELLFDTDFCLLKLDNEVVSLNLIDVIENAHHNLPFDKRMIAHGQRALRGEIISRYIAHPRTDESTTQQLAVDAGIVEVSDEQYPTVKTHLDSNPLRPSILAIGDIFTDAFIELDDTYARVETDSDGSKRLSLPFGSKPPYKKVDIVQAVGPSPNAAVSFSRLGMKASLLAFIGDDKPGSESLMYLKEQGIDTSLMSVQSGVPSNYYYVLRLGAERTILVKNEEYQYTWQEPAIAPDWIYLSLISQSSWQLHEDLIKYIDQHPDVKLAFQPGTFHFEWGVEKLRPIYARSHIVVMNREEAVDVTGKSYDNLRDLADGLHELGPKIVAITDGPNGSYASFDGKLVTIPNYPDPAPPVDRTGAGDAFASTIVAALASGQSMETALSWAPINSMSVVQKLGAQAGLLRETELQQYLNEAPESYKVTEL